jgi:hypothetical protein
VDIYRSFVERGRAPAVAEIAATLQLQPRVVEASLQELHDDDVIVLHPGSHDIWLAHPFCADPAPFEVTSSDRRWDAICIWDALGILEVVGSDGAVRTSCPDCGKSLEVIVRDGDAVAPPDYVVHFGVPAARWYEDVAYT